MVCTVWLGPCWLAGVVSWTLQVCWWSGIEVICTWHLGRSSVVRVLARLRVALMGGIGWLKPSWREVKSSKHHDVLGSEYLGVLCRYLREEGELACLCLVSALVIQPVLLCGVLRRFVHATVCGKHPFVISYNRSIHLFWCQYLLEPMLKDHR